MDLGSIDFNQIIMILVGVFLFVGVLIALKDQGKRNQTSKVHSPANRPLKKAVKKQRSKTLKKHSNTKPFNNTIIYQILKENKLAINNVIFNLNYLLDEVAGVIASGKDIDNNELIFDIEKNVPVKLIGDPMRLTQILINLIDNAEKTSRNDIITLKIAVMDQNESFSNLRFEIIDTSSGMSREQISELLEEPGEEIVDNIKMAFFVADKLVTLMGGNTNIASEPGKGTAIDFDLRLTVPKKYQAYHYQIPSADFEEEKVIIVEKFSETAKVLKKLLSHFSANIETKSQIALQSDPSQLENFNMAIIDESLYDLEIESEIKRIKSIKPFKIVLTENILLSSREKNRPYHAVDSYLTKPFTLERIIEMLIGFYGEGNIPVAESDDEELKTEMPGTTTDKINDIFRSDAEIPVQANIIKDNFRTFVGSKVLITEDNVINQKVIMGLLGNSGINLKLAEHGQEALDILEEEAPFDLVLMDINMPVMDGYEATRRIRENRSFDTMPIVAFTGLNLKEEIDKMREVGMNAHMAKPLNIGRIYSIFQHYLPKKDISV